MSSSMKSGEGQPRDETGQHGASSTAHQGAKDHPSAPPSASPSASTSKSTPAPSKAAIPPAPSISLPKGGGAIRGIGEKFEANPVTGTGSMTVPIVVSSARSGSGPQLALSYDSGQGNGAFGLGWHLSQPAITRKTDKGLPRYQDATESDVFILSGAEDLVPLYQRDQRGELVMDGFGNPVYDDTVRDGFTVRRYRPRVEGMFARIERWTHQLDGDIHWRSITRDNVTTLYGKDGNSRIAAATDPTVPGPPRIFSWLICQSYDSKGNAITYEYKPEDSVGVPVWRANEYNRTDQTRSTSRYLKTVRYGNRQPNRDAAWTATDAASLPDQNWMFRIVFDYGEHDLENPSPQEQNPWMCRDDPFSSYRSGFEVRTYRLCRRILMFHSFPDQLGPGDDLVQSMDLAYNHGPVVSFMTSVTRSGYARQPDQSQQSQYVKKSLPPLEFEYSQPPDADQLPQLPVQAIEADSIENLPYGVDGSAYSWVDLDGEGVAGIFTEQSEGWFYKRNLSANNRIVEDGIERTAARFGPLEHIMERPAASAGAPQFMDLAGDGQIDLVLMDGLVHGFYKRTSNFDWLPFRAFSSWPNVDTHSANLKYVDLNGDGHADILIAENDLFTWYPSLAEDGFGAAVEVSPSLHGDEGPRLVFADAEGAIYLADLSGDGLSDLVRIRNGQVDYWPNLGYGSFGNMVTMDDAPWFDHPDQFNQSRIRLADIDGSGTADIIYLGPNTVDIYHNQAGNGWSEADRLASLPPCDQLATVTTIDLLGTGTICIVWSSSLPGNAHQPMYYVDLMDGHKPHLLTKFVNNLGAETRIQYAPSTFFYESDREAGTPWLTRLAFPVQCVERVDIIDYISNNHFVTRYAYHHGFYDGIEREFNGFGMVEQWDTEELGALNDGSFVSSAQIINISSNVPPIHTKTWFHTGVFFDQDAISRYMAHEYYGAPTDDGPQFEQFWDTLLDDTVLPLVTLTPDEMREACRSLKGSILRQETYAEDGSPKAGIPYNVSESNYTIEFLQPQGNNLYSIFFTHPRESISYHYERSLDDPRVNHTLVLEVDIYGDVLRSVTIGYGRQPGRSTLQGEDSAKQQQLFITYTEEDFTNAVDEPDDYCTPLCGESRNYEVTGFALRNGATRFDFATFATDDFAPIRALNEIPFEQGNDPALRQKRLIGRRRTLFRSNDLSRLLLVCQLQSMTLPGEEYKLAFTPGLLSNVYQRKGPNGSVENLLPNLADVLGGHEDNQAGLVDLDSNGHWWVPSGQVFYHPDASVTPQQELAEARASFFLQRRFVDPFNHTATADYDDNRLLLVHTRDAMNNVVTTVNDYRVLEPVLVTDPNGNRRAVAFDALGLVVGTAIMGKESESLGDNLTGFRTDLSPDEIAQFFSRPKDPQVGAKLLGGATTRIIYDVTRYWLEPDPQKRLPVFGATISRETHASDPPPADGLKLQINFAYSDGFGREIQHKVQAEPGAVDGVGSVVDTRWVGSGWTIYNNKGNPVRQYEPFFDDTHEFKFNSIRGVSPVVFYDAMERPVATLHPDHSWEKVVFDPWQQTSYDVNDTVLMAPKIDPDVGYFFNNVAEAEYLPTWYDARKNGQLGPQARSAATKTAVHANTPSVAYSDSLGRTFLTVIDNGADGKYSSRTVFDIEGNQREVIDANGRVVMRYDYNLLNTHLHQSSMEAGERWTLQNAAGSVLLAWNSRNLRIRTAYDAVHRHIASFLQSDPGGAEQQVERIVYGETLPTPEPLNQRGKSVQIFDQAGVVTNDAYDFKGNLLHSQRQFAQDYKTNPDWSPTSTNTISLESAIYSNSTRYDALNRVVEMTTPDNSVLRLLYSEANLPDQISVNLRGAQAPSGSDPLFTPFIRHIDYDAKGQRTQIDYGNGARTTFAYDAQTFRLTDLQTIRSGAGSSIDPLQSLHYTYDPSGNITSISDTAQQTIYFRNRRVEPSTEYAYDAIYRLISATGREHLGLSSNGRANAPTPPSASDTFQTRLVHPGDGNALGNYTESYIYDAVGNILAMRHGSSDASTAGWTRSYSYNEPSQLEPGKKSNRLSGTSIGSSTEKYSYNNPAGVHGMMSLPHLSGMEWDYRDQLHATSQQVVDSGGTPETTFYVYDGSGQRTRKVTERQASAGTTPTRLKERVYLGVFEIYREYAGDGTTVSLERETLNVMDESQRAAVVETRTQGQDSAPSQLTRYQFTNQLGSALLELDDQAQIVSYEEYFPFGSTSYQAVRSQVDTPKRYRYTGKERDEENGLYYHGARYYACWLGRWTSCDPKDLADGDNLYQYVHDNPINHNDPTGTLSWGQVAGIAAAVVVGTVVTVATAGLAGPVVGAAAAAIIGGAVGGAAGGAIGAAVETKIDKGEVDWEAVKTGAITGAVTGAVFAGGGQALSAIARSSAAKAVGTGIAESAAGKFVGKVASSGPAQAISKAASRGATWAAKTSVGRAAKAAVQKGISNPLAALHEAAESAGTRLSIATGIGKAASESAWASAGVSWAPESKAVTDKIGAKLDEMVWEGGPAPKIGKRAAAYGEANVPKPPPEQGVDVRVARARSGKGVPDKSLQKVPHVAEPKTRSLTTYRVGRVGEPIEDFGFSRGLDAELKVLESFNGAPPGTVINLGVSQPMCPSCITALYEFLGNNPGVTVNVYAAVANPLPAWVANAATRAAAGAATGTVNASHQSHR